MNTTHERLLKCFGNVFPDIAPDEIPRASTSSLAAWDSVGHVVLLSAISEEFGCDIAPEDFEQLVSYDIIAQYVIDCSRDFRLDENVLPDELKRERSTLVSQRTR